VCVCVRVCVCVCVCVRPVQCEPIHRCIKLVYGHRNLIVKFILKPHSNTAIVPRTNVDNCLLPLHFGVDDDDDDDDDDTALA